MLKVLPILWILLFFTQCKLGEPYQRSEDLPVESYRIESKAGASIANMPWWELFGDAVLADLIDQGIQNNLDLNSAIARIAEAEAQLGVVRANLYPRVNYGGDATLSGTSLDSGDAASRSGSAFGTVSYQVDLWGRLRNLNEAARQELLATEEAYRSLTLIITSSIAQAYLQLRDLDNRLIISERTAKTWKDNLDIVQARFNAGIVSEVDLRQGEIQVQEALTTIQTFTRLRIQTENAISTLVGLPPMKIERGQALQDQVFPPELPQVSDANVVIMMFDAQQEISNQDTSLLGFALNEGRAIVIAINKWDGLADDQRDWIKRELERKLNFIDFARMHFISALHGTAVGDLFRSIDEAYAACMKKISTSDVNRALEEAIKRHQPPLVRGRRIKLRYAHVGGHNPPTIIIHGNQVDELPDSYKRYLTNTFRKAFNLVGTPIRLFFEQGDNPYKDRKNTLSDRQVKKRRRLKKFVKKKR